MEKILKIEDVDNLIYDTIKGPLGVYTDSGEGYRITTDQQEILLLIDNNPSCCEGWGHFASEDNLDDFVGADLLSIEITDVNRTKTQIKDLYLDEGEVMFVDFNTSKGTLQLAVYNAHNGYYGHSVILKSNQLTEVTYL